MTEAERNTERRRRLLLLQSQDIPTDEEPEWQRLLDGRAAGIVGWLEEGPEND